MSKWAPLGPLIPQREWKPLVPAF